MPDIHLALKAEKWSKAISMQLEIEVVWRKKIMRKFSLVGVDKKRTTA